MGEPSVKCANCESAFVTDRLPDSCPVCGRTVYAMAAPAPMPEEVDANVRAARNALRNGLYPRKCTIRGLLSGLASQARRLAEVEGERKDAWCPDVCPFTGLEFFMWIEQRDGGRLVPTYGGPYDSYTIPERDDFGEYTRERYDHDEGCWTDYEAVPIVVMRESDQLELEDRAESTEARVRELEALLKRCRPYVSHLAPDDLQNALRATEAPHE